MKTQSRNDVMPGGMFELTFGLGWAAADKAHLPALPEALARLLNVPVARVAVFHLNGKILMEHAYAAPTERGEFRHVDPPRNGAWPQR